MEAGFTWGGVQGFSSRRRSNQNRLLGHVLLYIYEGYEGVIHAQKALGKKGSKKPTV